MGAARRCCCPRREAPGAMTAERATRDEEPPPPDVEGRHRLGACRCRQAVVQALLRAEPMQLRQTWHSLTRCLSSGSSAPWQAKTHSVQLVQDPVWSRRMRSGARRAKTPISAPSGHTARQKNLGHHCRQQQDRGQHSEGDPTGRARRPPCHNGRMPEAKAR